MKNVKKKKGKVAKVRVEPKNNVIPDLKHNHYAMAMSSTPLAWQTDPFIWIASCTPQEGQCLFCCQNADGNGLAGAIVIIVPTVQSLAETKYKQMINPKAKP